MPAALEEIKIVFGRECIRRESWIVAEATIPSGEADGSSFLTGQKIKIVGSDVDEGAMESHQSYRLFGRWETTPYGKQFSFKTFVAAQPLGRVGVVKYLQQAPNVGEATATALWNKFRGDAVRVLRETPEVAASTVPRFSVEKATEAAEYLQSMRSLEECTIEIMGLLDGRGFPKKVAKEAIKKWGNRAVAVIQHNPYILMRFRGCGFLKTDAMYLDLGHSPTKLKRQALCAWYSIASDTNGHTWYPLSTAIAGIKAKIAGVEVESEKALTLAKRAGMLSFRRDDNGNVWVAEKKCERQEGSIAARVSKMLATELNHWPNVAGIEGASEHQQEKIIEALQSPIAILSGSPGTGKTWLAAAVIGRIIREFGTGSVAVAAPTGKAAVRITEAMQGYGIDIQATTIHRLLCVESAEDGWTFQHHRFHPLDYRFIFVDESSMIDVPLMASLLDAIAAGTCILFIGDTNQLPPVGHGAPLRDLIAAGVPMGELREIRRNSGDIVRVCAAIRDGETFVLPPPSQLDPENGHNICLVPATKANSASKIVELVRNIGRQKIVDPVWGVQCLVAVNKRSPVARDVMNDALQRELNPGGERRGKSPFALGDKTLCLKNSWPKAENEADAENENGQIFVANGEQGRAVEAAEKFMVVEMATQAERPKRVRVPHGGGSDKGDSKDDDAGTGCDWALAYAITTHKSQGSEWPIVIVALDEYPGATGPRGICDRHWAYTAISRAKVCCFLVGSMSTLRMMLSKQSQLAARKTFLVERIGEAVEQLSLSPPERDFTEISDDESLALETEFASA